MDHDEVRELLELAAVEPAGLDRLMAGDTPQAAAVASHLVGCPACTEELGRLRRAAPLIAETIRTTAPPELRERTLAHVRTYGRVAAAGRTADAPAATAAGALDGSSRPGPSTRRVVGTRLAWAAAIAAAIVVSVVATSVVLESRTADRLAEQESRTAGLARVTAASLALGAEPDAARVDLEAGSDAPEDAWGSLVYSPGKAELVVIASGLTEPAPNREYRCWVEVDGQREPVGKMFFGGGLSFWAGPVDAVADLPDGATFGVTLVDATGDALEGPATLAGDVGG